MLGTHSQNLLCTETCFSNTYRLPYKVMVTCIMHARVPGAGGKEEDIRSATAQRKAMFATGWFAPSNRATDTSYLLVLRVASDMVPTTGAHAPCTGVTHGAAGVSGAAVAVAAT